MNQPKPVFLAAGCLLVGIAIGALLPFPIPPSSSAGEQAREALAIADPLSRSARLGALLERTHPDALPALKEAIEAAHLDAGDPEVVSFAMWWARFDPKAALAWTNSDWRAGSRLVIGAVFRAWAHTKPDQAFEQATRVTELARHAAIDAVIAGWFESGQPGLMEHVQSLPDEGFRQTVGESLARRVVLARGAEGAMRWVESIVDSRFRQTMARRVASAASEQGEGAVVAAWAMPYITSGDEHPSGFPRRIGTRWILKDSTAALAWLKSLPAGSDRNDGVAESFRDWLRFAPGAAVPWIETAEREPWLEPALAIYARWIAREHPREALELVARFSDVALRDRTTTVLARAWVVTDREAAKAWLAQADLPDDVRRRASSGLRAAR